MAFSVSSVSGAAFAAAAPTRNRHSATTIPKPVRIAFPLG